jgi:hypothetical protein
MRQRVRTFVLHGLLQLLTLFRQNQQGSASVEWDHFGPEPNAKPSPASSPPYPILSSLNIALVLTCSGASTAYVFSVVVVFFYFFPCRLGFWTGASWPPPSLPPPPTPPATPFIVYLYESIKIHDRSGCFGLRSGGISLQLTRGRGLGSFGQIKCVIFFLSSRSRILAFLMLILYEPDET